MQITNVKCPTSKYSIKCPYTMIPEGITVHNTANDASAMSEVSYMIGRPEKVSFHAAVDDYRIVTGLPYNRSCFASGDGRNGFGNRKTINIEICYSKSGGERFDKAEHLAAEYIAYLLKQYGWGIDKVGTHQMRSGKYCPHRTLDRGWQRFLDMIKAYLDAPAVKPKVDSSHMKDVQRWLIDTYNSEVKATGKADAQTKIALVKAWKKQCNEKWGADFAEDSNGNIISGQFGEKSKDFAKKVIRHQGESGKMIKLIQALCYYHGYNKNSFSGNYGSGTVEDVLNFKKAKGLSNDGTVVGQNFWVDSFQ